ncbi:DUF4142 domain-containing protein [Nocardia sp. CS682]|uniref:DUF4142 domain-containing protein n=1 Tax=Nocardia sp. CS682 TaxID=1047172 RepID=UPI0010754A18|nr:DUF4142 domain-containing protein [Nocardia sp. CS682]QBS39263.1 hypothetical protein DMB37_03135 [Nocardia sp. CS682]
MRSLHRALRTTAVAAVLGFGAATVGFGTVGVGSAQPADPVALSDQDSTYLVASHQSHMSEMISGSRAALAGECPAVRAIGAMLVVDHTRLDAMGAAVALPNGVALPLTPNAEQSQQMWDTGMRIGRDFDLSWLRMQERFHVQALQAGARQLELGTDERVTRLARDAAPTVQHHLTMVRDAMTTC